MNVSLACLHLANGLMPDSLSPWAEAMRAEFSALPKSAQPSFAIGCLKTALYARASQRQTLALIGRGALAVCLLMFFYLSFAGIFPTQDPQFTRVIRGLFFAYGTAGILALLSLRWLIYYALAGVVLSLMTLLLPIFDLSRTLGLSSGITQALNVEVVIFALGLLFVASFLNLLQTPCDRAHHVA
jgi:hypothetical protein